jgi:hypothetical protein
MIPGSEPKLALKDDPVIADAFKMIYATPWPGEVDFENKVWQYFTLANRPEGGLQAALRLPRSR